MERSISDSVLDDRPIFMKRLVEESGGIMHRWAGPGRQGRRHSRQALLDQLAGQQQVGSPLEDQVDDREGSDRLRAHDVEALDAIEGVLERNGDELLNLGGRQPKRRYLDLDARRSKFGEDIDRRVLQLPRAKIHQGNRSRDDEKAELDAFLDDEAHHGGAALVT